MSHRQIGGIHHIDPGDILRRQFGILITAGKAHADIDMDHSVIPLHQSVEQVLIIRHIHGVGGGDLTARVHMGNNV